MKLPHFINPLAISGHLGCFHILAATNNTSVNMGVQIYHLNLDFTTEIKCLDIRFSNHVVCLFLIFCGVYLLFSIWDTILYSCQQCASVPFSRTPMHTLLVGMQICLASLENNMEVLFAQFTTPGLMSNSSEVMLKLWLCTMFITT